MQDLSFEQLATYFPAVLAPALVAHLRRRWPQIDGALVWLVVVVAAVVFSVVIGLVFGQTPSLEIARRGVLLGLAAAGAHTMAKGKLSEAKPQAMSEPEEPPPASGVVEASQAWTSSKDAS